MRPEYDGLMQRLAKEASIGMCHKIDADSPCKRKSGGGELFDVATGVTATPPVWLVVRS